jgi:hypothetical protein
VVVNAQRRRLGRTAAVLDFNAALEYRDYRGGKPVTFTPAAADIKKAKTSGLQMPE